MNAVAPQPHPRRLLALGLVICVSSTATWPIASARTELSRQQERTGLSLVTLENWGIQVVVFSQREMVAAKRVPGMGVLSPDGTEVAFAAGQSAPGRSPHLAISRTDGNDLREFPSIQIPPNNRMCWSNDKSKLVTNTPNGTVANPPLRLVNLSSDSSQEITSGGSVTSQCWSRDSKQLVYEANGVIRIYDSETGRSSVLVKGREATWSPDGNRIAFLDGDTYCALSPSGTGKEALFKKWHAISGLWWSPDSRFVAYVSQAGLLEGGLTLDVETYWLRVRRLKDNSESRVAGVGGGESFEWVTNTDLFKAAESNYGHAPLLPPGHDGEVFLVGNIAKQGWYQLKTGETILEVVAAAGGLTPTAKGDTVYIERTENNKHRRIACHFNKALQGRENAVPLRPGDVVVIP